ncbi:protein translocase subunit secE/sec61 gamma [Geoalkalibacter ferrihydriticus]|uniref:Protein translocase subunit SecE n=2 Tax=Geoalkalibacter ferrihydriticus TaxID=392333 RepID=A0A0C2HK17_9BACT|nr:preprotein translocase subunit SecE [Geoalkalibacter ferrihydriticus]KIH75375.1 preprotein translocase subunit SecE [Geoalkalibacter ferrihydriticus DSM 17813]SDL32126.1 protein translocase subunit secE/sec61 gamma [Geoalkalibacter ferrihydriticus]
MLNKTTEFLNHVKAELKKVTWPTRKETYASTTVVIVLVLFITVFLGTVDWMLANVVKMFLR